jgi:sucrose-6-phosphate hydrolase SacC (GH32 family)
MKKLLLITTLLLSSLVFAQQNQIRTNNSYVEKTIKNVSASPNPLINQTKISFYSSVDQNVILTIKNLLGKTVFQQQFISKKGNKSITFYKNNLDTGMYIYSIQSDSGITSKRLVIK